MNNSLLTIAIYPDDYTSRNTPDKIDASSPKWAEHIGESGHEVRWVDVRRPDILEQLEDCHGFMWRWAHFGGMGRIARRLLPVIENEIGIPVYPDQNTCWHYDDKIAQAYLLSSLRIPVPRSWVWFDRNATEKWARQAEYPMVIKLASGAGSSNVRLVHNFDEAEEWINLLFSGRVTTLDTDYLRSWKARGHGAIRILTKGLGYALPDNGIETQAGYVLFQEFLRNNSFDTRITVIGNRAFGFRRFNRTGDFRASGSGKIDWNADAVDPEFIRLAFKTARSIGSQSCAIDGLYRGDECVVGEISYTYVSWAVYECPGHWELEGTPEEGQLHWVEGQMWPEKAQVEDFLELLERKAQINS